MNASHLPPSAAVARERTDFLLNRTPLQRHLDEITAEIGAAMTAETYMVDHFVHKPSFYYGQTTEGLAEGKALCIAIRSALIELGYQAKVYDGSITIQWQTRPSHFHSIFLHTTHHHGHTTHHCRLS